VSYHFFPLPLLPVGGLIVIFANSFLTSSAKIFAAIGLAFSKILKSAPIKIALVAFIYNALAFISYQITVTPDNIAPIYTAAGFALASVLIMGRKTLIGIWIGSVVANLFSFWDTSQMLELPLISTILSASSLWWWS
jgi:hypothetical protein